VKIVRIVAVFVLFAVLIAILAGRLWREQRTDCVLAVQEPHSNDTASATHQQSSSASSAAIGSQRANTLTALSHASASGVGAKAESYQRSYISEASGKYGSIRVEERWRRATDPAAEDVLVGRTMMAAGHVMVQLREGRSRQDLEKTLRQHGFILRSALAVPRGFLVAVDEPDVDSVPALMSALQDSPSVEVVEPDYVYTLAETRPDDDYYGSLWGMETIQMPRVWDSTTGDDDVVVAIFDTGIDRSHVDLAANIWTNPDEIEGNGIDDDGNVYTDDINGWDFYDDDNDPTDVQQHGTHVAGTIGAIGNNGVGVAGVGWNIRLLPIKFFGYNDSGQLEAYTSDAVSGMYYVIALANRGVPVRITNHSWGGSGASTLLEDVFRLAGQYGILHVAAAGNGTGVERDNDIYPHYPANYAMTNIIAVANTTSSDGLSGSSYYGATSVDLGAPGEGILSTIPGGGYGYKTGTSMATPHVVGALALLLDMFPGLSWQEARDLLFASVDPVAGLNGYCTTGGRLNVYNLLAAMPTVIEHEPLPNSDVENTSFPVAISLKPGVSFVDTNKVELLWNTTGSTNEFSTNLMTYVGNNNFSSALPGKPRGTTIHYMIRVETTNQMVTTHPADAPVSLHAFDVTFPVALTVYGYPVEDGAVYPPYGAGAAPWGSTVDAVAPAFTDAVDGRRWRCSGWDGAGSVPLSGTTNHVSFRIEAPSYLVWWWQEQVSLSQQSDPAGIVSGTQWTDVNGQTGSVVAPDRAMVGGTEYAFIGWEIDGVRFPDAVSTAQNPAAPLVLTVPQSALARYIPVAQDTDADGLPDWWELFYFNTLDRDGGDDADGDGASNADEYADRSDPRDANSLPEGPTINHTPFPSPVDQVSPWEVMAGITDRVDIAVAVLYWQRNGGSWNELRMTGMGDQYLASIPSPDNPGDVFAYRIEAVDAAGNTNSTETFSFTVRYPVLGYSPGSVNVATELGSSSMVWVTLTNAGNATLEWQTVDSLVETVDPTISWSHAGVADQWHVSTQEFYSASYSWFCGDEGGGGYNNAMDASLYTPVVLVGGNARLEFMHWAEMEYDGRVGYENHYWDGAVVELSRDGGVTFESIEPIGGYPYLITPNDESPFAYNRPCLAGTTGGWELVEFDLADYAGESVQIRFRFGSDGYVSSRGWFLDDIRLTWDDSWLIAPASGTLAPSSTDVVSLQLVADSLSPGTVRGAWTAACNAPGNERFGVPITLNVTADTSMRLDAVDPSLFVLRWATQTGYTYHLSSGSELTNWVGVPGYTNLPGIGGFMSYTGDVQALPRKFYRILETTE
jgi:subtilisin family serine protease